MTAFSPSAPLVIGLPVYNGERYLMGALDALAAQTFTDFTLLISDNASTDGTAEICSEYAARDSRIQYVRRDKNMGGAWNFNSVVRETASPLFKWMTHDDLIEPQFIQTCIDALNSDSDDVILAYPRSILIDEEGSVLGPFEDRLDLRQEEPWSRLRAFLENYEMSNPIFGIIRRPLLLRTSLLGPYVSSDKVLLAEMAMVGRFRELEPRLFLRRSHAQMSRKANTTPDEIAAWFDPNQPKPVTAVRTKLFAEYTRAIAKRRLGLSRTDQVRCFRELVRVGGWHELHVIGGEMKRELKIRSVRAIKGISSAPPRP